MHVFDGAHLLLETHYAPPRTVVVNIEEHPPQPQHVDQRVECVGDVLEGVFVTIQWRRVREAEASISGATRYAVSASRGMRLRNVWEDVGTP